MKNKAMKINRDNYEAFFLDYFEHSLDAGQVAELMVFLEANPDLNEEFESFEIIRAESEAIPFDKKRSLRKKDYREVGAINPFNYEEFMVAAMENDLDLAGLDNLKEFLGVNPDARLEFDLFKKSRLLPDDVSFPSKSSLKKTRTLVPGFYRWGITVAAAASLLVLLVLFLQRTPERNPQHISEGAVEPVIEQIRPAEPGLIEMEKIQPRSRFKVATAVENAMPRNENLDGMDRRSASLTSLKSIAAVKMLEVAGPSLPDIEGRFMFENSFAQFLSAEPGGDKPSFASRFLQGAVNKIVGDRERPERSFLEYTVNGYNMIADREVEVEKHYDASGRIIAYQINGELIKFGHKVNPPGKQ